MSLRRYFQPATTLPTASQTQLSPNVLQEVNQAVRALQPKENGGKRASKRKYTTSFTRTCQGQATPIHALGVWLARAHRNAFIRFAM